MIPSFSQTSDSLLLNENGNHLSEAELNAYQLIDSVIQDEKQKQQFSELELLLNGKIIIKAFDLPLRKLINYNNFEGFRLGLGLMTNDKISEYFSVGSYFGYGFKDKAWNYGGDLILNLHKDSESQLHFSSMNDVFEKAGYHFFERADFSSSEVYRRYMLEKMDLLEKYEV